MLYDMLNLRQHEVAVAKDGEAGIEAAHQFQPDLILMDARMPVMDGVEATRRLREMAQFRDTPIIALSASADIDSVNTILDAGCDDHIAKPVKARALFDVLDRYLSNGA